MPPFGPIKRRDLIRALRRLGFEGPYAGGNHQFMVKDALKLYIPNPHGGDISRPHSSIVLLRTPASQLTLVHLAQKTPGKFAQTAPIVLLRSVVR